MLDWQKVLVALYETVEGSTTRFENILDVARSVEVTGAAAIAADRYLSTERLVRHAGMGNPHAQLTHEGTKEAQRLLNPAPEVDGVAPIYISNVTGNTSVVQGSQQVHVTQNSTIISAEDIARLKKELSDLEGGELSEDSSNLLQALSSPDPDKDRITEAAAGVAAKGQEFRERLKNFCGRVSSSVAGAALVTGIKYLLAAHGITIP